MNIKDIRGKIREAGVFFPFRSHFLLVVISLLLAAKWLRENNALPETSRTAIINVFISMISWFALTILLISFLTAFIPWLLFLTGKKNNRSILKLKTPEKDGTDRQQVLVNITHIIRPLFGYIRLRLQYDGDHISPKFSLVTSQPKKKFFSWNTNGWYHWPANHIKEYELNGSIIYFEDFFQFFSFASKLPAQSNFYTYPLKRSTAAIIVQPKKTEETNLRIEEIRKVEGELINYKNFEHNDDVRRIVWKIYAKNKELVVRIPETNDPYASHIYFYASFFNAVSPDMYEEFNTVFLDGYKTVIWNAFEQLYRQHAHVVFLPDQDTKTFYADDPLQKTRYIISTTAWQKQHDLLSYFQRKYGSILCISSLTDPLQLEEVLEKSGGSFVIIFVPLSKTFSNIRVTDWLQWVLIKPEKKSTDQLQLAYNFSPLHRKISVNEKKIREILKKSECEVLVMETGE